MKYIGKIALGLTLCMGLLSSCKDDDGLDSLSGISVDKESISVGPDGGVENIQIRSNSEWTSSSSQPWVMISPSNGLGSVDGTLSIDSTLEITARTAQVRFRQSDNQETIVNIIQFGYGKQILPEETEVEVPNSEVYEKRYFDVTVSTNVAFKVDPNIEYSWGEEIPESEKGTVTDDDLKGWITAPKDADLQVDLDRKDRPRTITAHFRWEMNTAPYKRVAKIKLVPVNADDQLVDQDGNPTGEVVLTVTQEAAVKITDDRRGDSLAIVMINEKIQTMMAWDYSENMSNWEYVTLWEEDSEDKPADFSDEWIGRVRSVQFNWFDLKAGETLPKEVKNLKYLESFTIQTNVNRQLKDMHLGEEICELKHLKELNVYSYGLVDLPKNFINLGSTLEYLDLGSNNFPHLSTITDVVNPTNFPHLKGLELSTGRRDDTTNDLTTAVQSELTGGKLGIYVNLDVEGKEKNAFMEVMKWNKLEYLGLSYLFIEGHLPSDDEVLPEFGSYKSNNAQADASLIEETQTLLKDTCSWLVKENATPVEMTLANGDKVTVNNTDIAMVWPNMKVLSLNLNFITGDLPNWLLFHPYFQSWNPDGMIVPQWTKGKDSQGRSVGFDNVTGNPNFNYKYYYGDGTQTGAASAAYPKYYNKYVGGGWEEESEGETSDSDSGTVGATFRKLLRNKFKLTK